MIGLIGHGVGLWGEIGLWEVFVLGCYFAHSVGSQGEIGPIGHWEVFCLGSLFRSHCRLTGQDRSDRSLRSILTWVAILLTE